MKETSPTSFLWPAVAVVIFGGGCGNGAAAPPGTPAAEFRNHRRVQITGYEGSAMEPYISCDGRFLFFISTRSYDTTLSTLYAGDLRDGRVTSVRLVAGNMAVGQRGWLTMDAEISRDGSLLYFANARFTGGTVPVEADLSVARRVQGAFSVLDDSRAILANLNSRALEYAPATSADGLEIFFTRLEGSSPVILRSSRSDTAAPFGAAYPVTGITGFVEAPALTCDGSVLYYHRLEGSEFAVFRAERAR